MAVDRTRWDSFFGTGQRSEYDLTILTAAFTTDARYNNGQGYILLVSGIDEDEEPSEEMLSVGADWESLDGGYTLVHPRKTGSVNKSTVYGKWCDFAAEACLKAGESGEWLFNDGDPLSAKTWIGSRWRLREKQVGNAFTTKTGEKVDARYRLMPDEFLGWDSDTPQTVPEPAQSSVEAARAKLSAQVPPPAPSPSPAASNGDVSTIVTLASIAATSPDFATFINLALAIDDVVTDDQLAASCLDTSPSGFYALNHK